MTMIQSENMKLLKTTDQFNMGTTGSGDISPLFSTFVRVKE